MKMMNNARFVLGVLGVFQACSKHKYMILNDVLSVLRFWVKALSCVRVRATCFLSNLYSSYTFLKKLKHLRTLRTLATALFCKGFFVLATYFYLEHLEQGFKG